MGNELVATKEEYAILNSSTPKRIPLLWTGSRPVCARVSRDPIPGSFRFDASNAGEYALPAVIPGATDDWGHALSKADFPADHLRVEIRKAIALASGESLSPDRFPWRGATVAADSPGDGVTVSGYEAGVGVASCTRRVPWPWNAVWDESLEVTRTASGFHVSQTGGHVLKAYGYQESEPTGGAWTIPGERANGNIANVKVLPGTDIYGEGKVGLKVVLGLRSSSSPTPTPHDFNFAHNGLSGQSRVWTGDVVDSNYGVSYRNMRISWNASAGRWELLESDGALAAYQRNSPADRDCHFGAFGNATGAGGVDCTYTPSAGKCFGRTMNTRRGEEVLGDWERGRAEQVAGTSSIRVLGTAYSELDTASSTESLLGDWTNAGDSATEFGASERSSCCKRECGKSFEEYEEWLDSKADDSDGNNATNRDFVLIWEGLSEAERNSVMGLKTSPSDSDMTYFMAYVFYHGKNFQTYERVAPVVAKWKAIPSPAILLSLSDGGYGRDYHGIYTLLSGTGLSDSASLWRIYPESGKNCADGIYSIHFADGRWHVYGTMDGVYDLEYGASGAKNAVWTQQPVENGKKFWCYYDHCRDSWRMKIGETAAVAFGGVFDGASESNGYRLRYVPEDFCWLVEWAATGEILDTTVLSPAGWRMENGAVSAMLARQGNSSREVSNLEEPAEANGEYVSEFYDTDVVTDSCCLALPSRSYHLFYDLPDHRWKLTLLCSVAGDYALDGGAADSCVSSLSWSSDAFRVSWETLDDGGRWTVRTKNETPTLTVRSSEGAPASLSPEEGIYDTCKVWIDDSDDSLLHLSGDGIDFAGDYAEASDGVFRKQLSGSASYWAFEEKDGRWQVLFHDKDAEGGYARTPGSSASLDTYSKGDYSISWNPSGRWELKKADTLYCRTDAAVSPSECGWPSGTAVALSADGSLAVSGLAGAEGGYLPADESKDGFEREWEREADAALSTRLTVSFDREGLRWRILSFELDQNGAYRPADSAATGTARVWTHAGRRNSYKLLWKDGFWRVLDSSAAPNTLASQTAASDEPCDGVWESGASVVDPYRDGTVWNLGVRYSEVSERNYEFSGDEPSWQEYREEWNALMGKYTLEDPAATGSSRVWSNGTGGFIQWNDAAKNWVASSVRGWEGTTYGREVAACTESKAGWSQATDGDAADLAALSWTRNGFYSSGGGGVTCVSSPYEEFGARDFWICVGAIDDDGGYSTSNAVRIRLRVQPNAISSVVLELVGSDGSKGYTGFARLSDGTLYPTPLVTARFGAVAVHELRVDFSGIELPGTGMGKTFSEPGIVERVGRLPAGLPGDADRACEVTMTVQDAAGNSATATSSIVMIGRLWRMAGRNIQPDASGRKTRVFSLTAACAEREIPRSTVSDDEYVRAWEDVFYPSTHSYPTGEDGLIDEADAVRVSKEIDPTGKNGPTPDEKLRYDAVLLDSQGRIVLDGEGRASTANWSSGKTYGRLESSAYGVSGEGMRYWVIDNAGYGDFRLEFEHFDLSSQVCPTPRNMLAPYAGDVLVIYNADAEGAVDLTIDSRGNRHWSLGDTSKLRELYAVGGSFLTNDIALKGSVSGEGLTISGEGFTLPPLEGVSRVCIVLYTDGDFAGSGFKLKAGPKHQLTRSCWDLDRANGEIWVHCPPDATDYAWHSADRLRTSHVYSAGNAVVDPESGILTLDSRADANAVLGCFTVYAHLSRDARGNAVSVPPVRNCRSHAGDDYAAQTVEVPVRAFLLREDDCVDYREILLSCARSGAEADFSGPYDEATGSGKIVSGAVFSKDKGTALFAANPPAGRLFASYSHHTLRRLTSDGYGDLRFYDNALVPTDDFAATQLPDWTYVDLMVVNEGGIAISGCVLKHITRGYVSGASGAVTIDEVVDQNRPWDVQKGTASETVDLTKAIYSRSYFELPAATRRNAIGGATGSGDHACAIGTLAPRQKGFVRVFWCLATGADGSWADVTRGEKLWSSEISGKYFVATE